MKRFPLRRRLATISFILASLVVSGYGPCSSNQQPKTVADILVTAGNVKRDLRARNEITPQQDYDISSKLLEANRSYRAFIMDELARLAASGDTKPDPSARRTAINALIGSLRGLQDPALLGIKSGSAQKVWREAMAGLGTVIAGLDALQGGQ